MNATILNYPGFHRLPKAIRQMLVTSEDHFFTDAQPEIGDQNRRENSGAFWQPSCSNEAKGRSQLGHAEACTQFPEEEGFLKTSR